MSFRRKAKCIREVSNWSEMKFKYRFDNSKFDKKAILNNINITSPKLDAMMKNIKQLDKRDKKKFGKHFKHFIYSDIKGSYGAKIVASTMIAHGYRMAQKKDKSKLVIDLGGFKDKGNNFVILTSTDIFKLPISASMKNNIVGSTGIFNKRPENIHGALIRFVIGDSGFKEGIDLFDIKYIHILEPQLTNADTTQVIGRGTRMCGQKGLDFIPNVGWEIEMFEYNLTFKPTGDSKHTKEFKETDKVPVHKLVMKFSGMDVSKLKLTDQLLDLAEKIAVDSNLNSSINRYGTEEEEELEKQRQLLRQQKKQIKENKLFNIFNKPN